MQKVELGDLVQDIVTGFKGIAVGHTVWLHGCPRITIQPQGMNKDGRTYDSQTFDEPQLKIIKKAIGKMKDKPSKHSTGWPRPEPTMVSYKGYTGTSNN